MVADLVSRLLPIVTLYMFFDGMAVSTKHTLIAVTSLARAESWVTYSVSCWCCHVNHVLAIKQF